MSSLLVIIFRVQVSLSKTSTLWILALLCSSQAKLDVYVYPKLTWMRFGERGTSDNSRRNMQKIGLLNQELNLVDGLRNKYKARNGCVDFLDKEF